MAKPSRGRRSPSSSTSGSSSRSRSRSTSRSRSGSSPSRSSSSSSPSPSRRPSHRKSPKGPAKRDPSPHSKRTSPPPRKASAFLESVVLHIGTLSRNVNEGHLKEIFDIILSRQELMLRKHSCTWMVPKLMDMLLKQSSRYHHARKYLHPLNLFQVRQREMLKNLIIVVLTLRKMSLDAQKKLLHNRNRYLLQENDHLCLRRVDHRGDYMILLHGEG